jgi:hypothetical protein
MTLLQPVGLPERGMRAFGVTIAWRTAAARHMVEVPCTRGAGVRCVVLYSESYWPWSVMPTRLHRTCDPLSARSPRCSGLP